jgi:preprotein translocase subunit SecA
MLDRVKFETVSLLTKIEVRTQEEIDREEEERRDRLMRALQAQHAEAQSLLSAEGAEAPAQPQEGGFGQPAISLQSSRAAPGSRSAPLPPLDTHGTFVRGERKVGRNEPCPCGSGKKFKNCHGSLSSVE